jgi:hypothetical protein
MAFFDVWLSWLVMPSFPFDRFALSVWSRLRLFSYHPGGLKTQEEGVSV